jgi:cation transport ATPase
LGDRLGAIYTPVALTVALLAWAISCEAVRFLAVLVIATPCPLLIAILERYSKHTLARAILAAAKEGGIQLPEATEVGEQPGQGLHGTVSNHKVQIISRKKLIAQDDGVGTDQLPPVAGGLECVVTIDGHYAAVLRFRDAPRVESRPFVSHLGPKHLFAHVMLVSGDRESEVRYLADPVGITEIYAQKSPEEKLAIVRKENAVVKTLYVGDGINDAPAMMAATVGMAIAQNSYLDERIIRLGKIERGDCIMIGLAGRLECVGIGKMEL